MSLPYHYYIVAPTWEQYIAYIKVLYSSEEAWIYRVRYIQYVNLAFYFDGAVHYLNYLSYSMYSAQRRQL